ncbi:MAG TPA: hypothetical protein VNO70_27035 [Blastocatellia bacterium]|nr:hypothetical protein [Blastocatellia bacterium]
MTAKFKSLYARHAGGRVDDGKLLQNLAFHRIGNAASSWAVSIKSCRLLAACLMVFCLGSMGAVASQPIQDDETRQLWDVEFLQKRQKAKRAAPRRKKPAYKRVTPKTADSLKPGEGEILGLTLWRLRPSTARDDVRLLVQRKEVTPERIEAETPLAKGDMVRLGIESPRSGYLYVIDRELYADGTMGAPHLIFPTQRLRGGNNEVTAGRLIELGPFELTPHREGYKGEVLTVLVTATPLANLTVPEDMVALETSMVEQWEKQWIARAERFELVGGAGKTYTKAEKLAAEDGERLLTQADDLPQTLYRVAAKKGEPLLVTVSLKISK